MNAGLHHAGVQGYLVCKSAFVVFFIVKGKDHWDSLDRKERRINIRNFLHKRVIGIWRGRCLLQFGSNVWERGTLANGRMLRGVMKGPVTHFHRQE